MRECGMGRSRECGMGRSRECGMGRRECGWERVLHEEERVWDGEGQ